MKLRVGVEGLFYPGGTGGAVHPRNGMVIIACSAYVFVPDISYATSSVDYLIILRLSSKAHR